MNAGEVIGFAVVWFVVGAFFGAFLIQGRFDDMKEDAFKRGHMVQCLGKIGYYWECEK